MPIKTTKKRVKQSKIIYFYDVALTLQNYETLYFVCVSKSLPTNMKKMLNDAYVAYQEHNLNFNSKDFLNVLKNLGILNPNLKRKTLYLNHAQQYKR